MPRRGCLERLQLAAVWAVEDLPATFLKPAPDRVCAGKVALAPKLRSLGEKLFGLVTLYGFASIDGLTTICLFSF
jgi:hypothetical protein